MKGENKSGSNAQQENCQQISTKSKTSGIYETRTPAGLMTNLNTVRAITVGMARYSDMDYTVWGSNSAGENILLSTPVQDSPRTYPSSCKMSTGYLCREESGWGVALTYC
jgi:hypothetical protein